MQIQIQIQIFRFRLILFCQHTTFSNSNVCKTNEIIKYADMEAPIKTISGRYHRATRKINYTVCNDY